LALVVQVFALNLEAQGPGLARIRTSATRIQVEKRGSINIKSTQVERIITTNAQAIAAMSAPHGGHQGAMYRIRDPNY
jgi:hypothetical protein